MPQPLDVQRVNLNGLQVPRETVRIKRKQPDINEYGINNNSVADQYFGDNVIDDRPSYDEYGENPQQQYYTTMEAALNGDLVEMPSPEEFDQTQSILNEINAESTNIDKWSKADNSLLNRQLNTTSRQVKRLARKQQKENKDPNTTGGSWGSNVPWNAIGNGLSAVTSLTGVKTDENSTYGAEQKVGDALISSGNPYAAIAGLGVKTNSFISQATGTNINTMSNYQAKKLGVNKWENMGNSAIGFLLNTLTPGLGGAVGKTQGFGGISNETQELRGAFSGSVNNMDLASELAGNRYIFGKDKANDAIAAANRANDLITAIGLNNKPRISSAPYTARDIEQQNFNRYNGAGYQNAGMAVGKEGMKLISKEELQKVYACMKKDDDVQTFGDGGKIGIDTNVIPEGALHATKNHLEEVNPELDEVTEKGIPVVVTDENGDYQQVAEIEKEEIIFSKSLTEQIEKLWKENTPESMLEAGKLLAKELMENTVDNSKEVSDGDD